MYESNTPGPIDAIVPAYNEEPTVGDVVEALLSAGCFRRVLVVDDGSKDRTADVAAAAGATVIRTPQNMGKGAAMLYAFERLGPVPRVGFFDADLVDFEPAHARRMVRASDLGYDMVCGLRDYGKLGNPLQAFGPLITGERILQRWVLEALPESCWSGYSIETAMNDACSRGGGRVVVLPMAGVTIRGKVDKGGPLKGLLGHLKMFREIAKTEDTLAETDGLACALPAR